MQAAKIPVQSGTMALTNQIHQAIVFAYCETTSARFTTAIVNRCIRNISPLQTVC